MASSFSLWPSPLKYVEVYNYYTGIWENRPIDVLLSGYVWMGGRSTVSIETFSNLPK